jgi:integrase
MPHFPKPFFRPKRDRWYVELDGKQVNLGPDEETAFKRYHEIMAGRKSVKPGCAVAGVFVVAVLDQFLDWLQNRVQEGSKAPRTFDWYKGYLQSFVKAIPATLTVDRLQPLHVYQWVDGHTGWKTGKRGAMSAVQRALNWAGRAGLLRSIGGKSPIAGLEKPQQGRREQLVTPEEFSAILARVSDQEFCDLLEASWETGARPHELFTVEAAHVDLPNARWLFPIRESKGKKYQRVVYLTDKVLEITRRRMQRHRQGPIFRNLNGLPWTPSAVNCRFRRLQLSVGKRHLQDLELLPLPIKRLTRAQRQDKELRAKHLQRVLERRRHITEMARQRGVKYSLYAFRHAYCTQVLESGAVDAVTVSILMGHRDTQMISRVYSHLTERRDYLRAAVNRARGKGVEKPLLFTGT